MAKRDLKIANDIWKMCARDILFFTAGFVWTYDPRHTDTTPYRPFIPYPYQEEAIMETYLSVYREKCDALMEKTRDVGATWMPMIVFAHGFIFVDGADFLAGSRKEEYVDKTGDKKTLFWKLDFILENLPDYLRPPYRRAKLILENQLNGATITGESANPDFGRGDRKTAVMLDEHASCEHGAAVMAATDDTTPCRILVSTPKGTGNEFYRIRKNPHQKVITIHWSQHPEKNPGLYKVVRDKKTGAPSVEILDKEWHAKNPDYAFVMEPGGWNGLRSPWYDSECRRRSRIRVAQELDIDYMASAGQFADPAVIDRLIQDKCLPPLHIGELAYDTEEFKPVAFRDNRHGRLKIWGLLEDGKPEKAEYVIGGDVAAGTGASNSVWTVANKGSRCVVAEFVSPRVKPTKFAEVGVALSRWFHNAYLIWEANNHGRTVGDRVMELGYQNIYYRRKEDSFSKNETDVPGFWTTEESKVALVAEYLRAIEVEEFTHRCEESLEEVLEYVLEDGKIVHSGTKNTEDSSGAKGNHGDRVISSALTWHGMGVDKVDNEAVTSPEDEYPINSYGYRRQAYLESLEGQII